MSSVNQGIASPLGLAGGGAAASGGSAGSANNPMITNTSRVILEAIDALRKRKARPDDTRIASYVERRHGLSKEQVYEAIRRGVVEGSVLKVKYKDSISYRNPAKFSRMTTQQILIPDAQTGSPPISNSNALQTNNSAALKRILRTLRQLTRTGSESKQGVNLRDLLMALHTNKQLLNYDESHLERTLRRAMQVGLVCQMSNGNFILSGGKRIVPRKTDLDRSLRLSSEDGEIFRDNDTLLLPDKQGRSAPMTNQAYQMDKPIKNNTVLTPKRKNEESAPVRVSKRKKFKKNLGPDFLEPADLGLQYLKNSYDPRCDFCERTAAENKYGQPEELLICKDCDAKAHPSCMGYSRELAARSRSSPWQCMDCKVCAICEDSRDGDTMLVCDMCDRGFHMDCHKPPVPGKPIGKWNCSECENLNARKRNGSTITNVSKHSTPEKIKCDNSTLKYGADNGVIIKPPSMPISEDSSSYYSPYPANRDLTVNRSGGLASSSGVGSLKSSQDNTKDSISSAVNMPVPQIYPAAKRKIDLNEYMTKCVDNLIPLEVGPPKDWSVSDVVKVIECLGYGEYAGVFEAHEIDGQALLLMRRDDFVLGLRMRLGPALKIYSRVKHLQTTYA